MKRTESPTTVRSGPFRIVTGVTFFRGVNTPHGGGRVLLMLECGHEKVVKASENPKSRRARCRDCRPGVSFK